MIRQERGVALILVLVIVAMATVLASGYLSRQQLDIQRAGFQIFSDQGYFYALAAEEWAKVVLENDYNDKRVDSLDEDWAIELPFIEIEGGALSAKLTDMQGRLNVNNLVVEGKQNALSAARLQHLFTSQKAPAGLLEALQDWLDGDQDATGFNGAEDDYYTRLATPYLAPNRAIADVSELRLLRGMTDELYLALAPLSSALPVGTALNVNTAAPAVLESLGLPDGLAASAVDLRDRDAFKSGADFLARLGLNEAEFSKDGLAAYSSYFVLNVAVVVADVGYAQESLIYRDTHGKCRVLRRWRLPYSLEIDTDAAPAETDEQTRSNG